MSVICSDKTGTLTQNKMTVLKYYIDGRVTDCSCADKCVADRSGEKDTLSDPLTEKLVDFGVLCSDAENESGAEIGDPTEVALVNLAEKYGKKASDLRRQIPRLGELPFDSERKLMSTVHAYRGKQILITKGAVDVLCDRIDFRETASGVIPFTEEHREQFQKANLALSREGLRGAGICIP